MTALGKNPLLSDETPIFHLTVGQLKALINQNQQLPAQDKKIPEIYGVEELQKVTGYSKHTIWLKTSRSEIPHFKRDGRLFFRHKEILEWLTENRIETTGEFSNKMDAKLTGRRAKGWKK